MPSRWHTYEGKPHDSSDHSFTVNTLRCSPIMSLATTFVRYRTTLTGAADIFMETAQCLMVPTKCTRIILPVKGRRAHALSATSSKSFRINFRTSSRPSFKTSVLFTKPTRT